MSKDIQDRRVQKTRKLLQDSLIALISKKGYESVTIKEILDEANIGRSTFYMHFENKDELFHSCFDNFYDLFEQYNNSISFDKNHSSSLDDNNFTLNLFRFVERNHRIIKALLGKDGTNMFTGPIHDFVYTYIAQTLKKFAINNKITSLHLEMMACFLVSAFFGTLKWWIDKDMPCTVEEVNNYFKQLATYESKQILI